MKSTDTTVGRSDVQDVNVTAAPRRFAVGAEVISSNQVHFRLWAPAARRVTVVFPDRSAGESPLEAEGNGYFSGTLAADAGDQYLFRLDDSSRLYPDPVSRFQPRGPHEASQIVDALSYRWTDDHWPGVDLKGQVIYELHAGTFTREGTWAAAQRELEELRRIGITLIELMPVAEFEGRFGWGYDGVDLFAPSHLYGTPDDLRRFVDAAHGCGIGVILDVVYNHLGPAGNYLRAFSPRYFTDKYQNEWGEAINFDGHESGPVREFFVANATYWIDEFHFDGLRLDATQQIFDASERHILAEISTATRERAGGKGIVLIAENESQSAVNVRPLAQGGRGLDAVWNDDFHHSAMVALTGRAEAYYSDTTGHAQEFVSATKYGYLYQGQYYHWQQHPRGTPALDLPPATFVVFLQNHDQVANSARGLRGHLLTSPGRWRALTALMLLAPSTPLLFQGQEFGASSPFLYFADFHNELGEAVRRGRAEFLTQFPSVKDYESLQMLDDPGSEATFARCKLNFAERKTHAHIYRLHEDLLRLRRDTAVFREQRGGGVDGAVLSEHAFVLRYFDMADRDDRLLIVNVGADLKRPSFAEPLVAPPEQCEWRVEWSSEAPAYGGTGTPDLWPNGTWLVPAESAIVCAPVRGRIPRGGPVRRRTA